MFDTYKAFPVLEGVNDTTKAPEIALLAAQDHILFNVFIALYRTCSAVSPRAVPPLASVCFVTCLSLQNTGIISLIPYC